MGMSRTMEVLLVEDSADDVFLTQEAFDDAAVEVRLHVARDGEEAMDFLRGESNPRPDLMLLDLNMPRKDGREVLLEVRQDPNLTDIPIVVLTTSTSDEDILAAYQAHVNSYIRKPVTFERFAEAVKALGDYWFELVTLPPPSTPGQG